MSKMSDNEEKTIKRPQFYETGFIPFENTNEEFDKTVNLSNPVSIKEYLFISRKSIAGTLR